MNQVQMRPFELILRQDVATAARNPLECHPDKNTANKMQEMPKMDPSGPSLRAPGAVGAALKGCIHWLS